AATATLSAAAKPTPMSEPDGREIASGAPALSWSFGADGAGPVGSSRGGATTGLGTCVGVGRPDVGPGEALVRLSFALPGPGGAACSGTGGVEGAREGDEEL